VIASQLRAIVTCPAC